MQNNTEIQKRVFEKIKKILQALSGTNTTDQLVALNDQVEELQRLMNYLTVYQEFSNQEATNFVLQTQENQETKPLIQEFSDENNFKNTPEEEVISEENLLNKERMVQEEKPHFASDFQNEEEENIEEDQTEENQSDITRKINFDYEVKGEEKKIKLSHIKGLKKIEEDPGEYILEDEARRREESSLLKSNVSIDYMEAEPPKGDFKLDLNDKIAFSKMLFNGNQAEMEKAIDRLNDFKTLEEAKEYLSEIYYEKNWENADEYAQRLWSLVENKFM